MKPKANGKIKKLLKYLSYHKQGCSIGKAYGVCNCGRNDAVYELDNLVEQLKKLKGD